MVSSFVLAALPILSVVAFLLLARWFLRSFARRKRYPQSVAWMGMLVLLVVLAGCGGPSSSNVTSSPTQVPTPPPTPQQSSPTPTAKPAPSPTPTTGSSANGNTGSSSSDWTTYHNNTARTGYVPGVPDPKQLTQAWRTGMDGSVYAEPLVVGGRVIIATENDSLYSLDQNTGAVQWRTTIGTPVARSTLPCGNVDPLGITGTPVYDPATGLVFAVGEISSANGPQHFLVGVDVNSGVIKVKRGVDVNGMNPSVHQQRAALALYQNYVYIAYGGLAGDCGNYHGVVVASRTDGQGQLLFYQVPTTREGGIWATSGPAIDSVGKVYVAVGNGETTSGAWDHSDSVLRLSSTLQYEDGYAPTNWGAENSVDADLGSIGPLLLPNGLLFVAGKDGKGYLMRANALGGVGGPAFISQVCTAQAFGGAATVGSQIFVPCNEGVREITIGSGTQFSKGWQASGELLPPVIGGHTVYGLDYGGTLYAYNIDNGAFRTKITLENVSHFATPTIANGRIFVGTLSGVYAVKIS